MKRLLARHGARWLAGLFLTLLAALQVTGDLRLDPIDRMDTFFADLRLRMAEPELDERIVIVDIDERSIAEIGHFPWNRKVVANLVTRLTGDYEVAAAGFDIVFAEADDSSGYDVLASLARKDLRGVPGFGEKVASLRDALDYDGLMAKAMEGQNVVLGYNIADQRKGLLPAPAFTQEDLNGRIVHAVEARGFLANLPRLQESARGAGIFTAVPDADGILRRSPLLMKIGDGYYPALSLATVAAALDARAIAPGFDTAADELSESERAHGGLDALLMFTAVQREPFRIPIGEKLMNMIEFRGTGGPSGGAFRYVSAADVLAGKVPKDTLEGAIVLVGTTAPGLQDLRATPVDSQYPGVEVHANLIKSILDGEFKQRPDFADGIELLLVALVGIVLALSLAVLAPLYSILAALAVSAGVAAFNYWAYASAGWTLSMAMPLVLASSLFVFNLGWGYLFEFRKGRALVSRFGEYVAPELVAEMAEDPDKYSMEGESRALTVMFVDVRGFTTISEGLSPRQLREYINLYLTAMSEDIRGAYRGTLDKYIGDAVMAFWGAPVAFPDHASRGVATALLMQESAARLNRDFIARGWPELKIGIGVNSGVMHVGDMGSAIRKAYTVMGDAVNLGSRLEGITKVYGVGICVGEATRAAAPEFLYRELDLVRVKGKNEPVAIFEPVARADEVTPACAASVEQWNQTLADVRAQRWDEAEVAIRALAESDPGSSLYSLYLERIAHYRACPPGPDWDAVTNLENK